MKFFKDNSFKSILIIGVLFLLLPFLIPEGLSVTAGKMGASQELDADALPLISKNPMAKFIDRVSSFYGFKKTKRSNGLDKLNDLVKRQSAVFSHDSDKNEEGSDISGLAAALSDSSRSSSSADFSASAPDSSSLSVKATSGNSNSIQIDGKTYEVLQDPAGKKYVLSEKGPIPFDRINDYVVSKRKQSSSSPAVRGTKSVRQNTAPIYDNYNGGNAYAHNNNRYVGTANNYKSASAAKNGGGSAFDMGSGRLPSMGDMFGESKTNLGGKYDKVSRGAGARATNYASSRGGAAPANTVAANNHLHTSNTTIAQPAYTSEVAPRVNSVAAISASDMMGHASIGNKYMVKGIERDTADEANGEAKEKVASMAAVATMQRLAAMPEQSASAITASMVATEEPEKKPISAPKADIEIAEGRDAVIPVNDNFRKMMSSTLLKMPGGETFTGELKGQNIIISDPWILPNSIKVNREGKDIESPAMAFYAENKTVMEKKGAFSMEVWSNSDTDYNDTKVSIRDVTKTMAPINLVVADAVVKDTALGVNQDNFYYKVSEGLLNGKVVNAAKDGSVNLKTLDKDNTLFVTFDKDTADTLRNENKDAKVSVMDITPDGFKSFYADTKENINLLKNAQLKKQAENNKSNLVATANGAVSPSAE